MAETRMRARRPQVEDPARELKEWLQLLNELVETVKGWLQPEWSTRVIEKEMHDSVLGNYEAPALLMQREIARVLLEPITRFAPGTDGVVQLYLMPAFDDIATLYRVDSEWKLQFTFQGDPVVAGIRNAEARPLNKENILRILQAFGGNAQ
jgi:hypothetical protein